MQVPPEEQQGALSVASKILGSLDGVVTSYNRLGERVRLLQRELRQPAPLRRRGSFGGGVEVPDGAAPGTIWRRQASELHLQLRQAKQAADHSNGLVRELNAALEELGTAALCGDGSGAALDA